MISKVKSQVQSFQQTKLFFFVTATIETPEHMVCLLYQEKQKHFKLVEHLSLVNPISCIALYCLLHYSPIKHVQKSTRSIHK